MPRNYENEVKWAKEKYIEVRAKVNREEYEATFNNIKNSITVAEFLKRALKLYESNPELFKDVK